MLLSTSVPPSGKENRPMDDLFKPELFRHAILMTVRFGDLDALAHVNHAAYLTYMEQARMSYARDVWGWDSDMKKLNIIVARATVELEDDYSLKVSSTVNRSTCIDQIPFAAGLPTTDFRGNPRPTAQGGKLDVGAFEVVQ